MIQEKGQHSNNGDIVDKAGGLGGSLDMSKGKDRE